MFAPFTIGNGTDEADVGGRKSIRLPQLTQSDILCRPFSDAANGPQPSYGIIEVRIRIEKMRICKRGRRDGRQRLCTVTRHAKGCQICFRQRLGSREDMSQLGVWLSQSLAIGGYQPPGQPSSS